MLIVSQNRTTVYNLDKIKSISVEGVNYSYQYGISINNEFAGKYRSKERAQEVLDEIVEKYATYQEPKFYTLPQE